MEALIARLKEVSTWQGIISVVTGFGVAVSPELSDGIIGIGVAVFGLVSVIWKERGARDAEKQSPGCK